MGRFVRGSPPPAAHTNSYATDCDRTSPGAAEASTVAQKTATGACSSTLALQTRRWQLLAQSRQGQWHVGVDREASSAASSLRARPTNHLVATFMETAVMGQAFSATQPTSHKTSPTVSALERKLGKERKAATTGVNVDA